MSRPRPSHARWLALPIVLIVLSACSTSLTLGRSTSTGTGAGSLGCPSDIGLGSTCFSPQGLQAAYGVDKLIQQGITGRGQTIVDIVSFGSPTLQADMDVFDKEFGLPPITLKVVAPLGTTPINTCASEMSSWAGETALDVEIMHAIAPDANIVVMTSPVDETEGTIGLPEFLKLEQYVVDHKLGYIFSQSWSASEATLGDAAGQAEVAAYSDFYKTITGQGYTVLSASGDNGAADIGAITDPCKTNSQPIATSRTIGFPADVPWVTTVGGTSLTMRGGGYEETAWSDSGGGVSKFFAEPSAQQALPSAVQAVLGGKRGEPDVAADADPATGMAFYIDGRWDLAGGTSASAPVWAGIVALADQKAGHPLGDINPALYALGANNGAKQDFRDVTQGDNSTVAQGTPVQGFPAAPGWDPVTGWGAPLADKLVPDLAAK